jgi:G:T-mismatch repair DNA endonuclease (very short patch repair protein)
MDVHTIEKRSKNMLAIGSKNTKIEVRLRRALWDKGYPIERITGN